MLNYRDKGKFFNYVIM